MICWARFQMDDTGISELTKQGDSSPGLRDILPEV